MKLPSQSSILHGRHALFAASVAVLFGTATAVAQSGATGSAGATSAGSSQKNPSSTSSSSTWNSGSKTSGSSDISSQTAPSSSASSAAGNTLNTGAAADVDSTKEINAQTSSTTSSIGAGAATGRETTSNKLGWMDRRFVTKAADDGQAEVQIAQLATQRASNSEVKAFAQKLVDDHTKVNEELKSIASQKNVKLDNDDDKDRTYKRLNKKSGMEFDQEFVEHMIEEHEKDIKMFEKAAKDAKDSDVRAFAAKHVEDLRGHLQHVQGLRQSLVPTGRMNGSSSSSSSDYGTSGSSSSNSDKTSTSDGSSHGSGSTGSSTYGTGSTSGSSSSDDTSGSSAEPKHRSR